RSPRRGEDPPRARPRRRAIPGLGDRGRDALQRAPERAPVGADVRDDLLSEDRLALELGGRLDELVIRDARVLGALPPPELPGDVRDAEHLRAHVAQTQDGLAPEHAAVEVAHAEDADPAGVLAREPAHRRERALRELVVVVHEDEVRPLCALDHRSAGGLAEVLVARAADDYLVARLELRRNAPQSAAERRPAPRRDDDGEGHLVHHGIIRTCARPGSSSSRTTPPGGTTSASSSTSSTATRR